MLYYTILYIQGNNIKPARSSFGITNCLHGFYCANGWDAVTGLGTLNFLNFKRVMMGLTPTTSFPSVSPPPTPFINSRRPTSAPQSIVSKVKNGILACFSGTEMIRLEKGRMIPISNVEIGDRILSANSNGILRYAEVIYLPHKPNTIMTEFTQITLSSGKDIKMTSYHLVVAGKCGQSVGENGVLPLVFAADVRVGECVLLVDGENNKGSSILKEKV